jgi:hypothetical protein
LLLIKARDLEKAEGYLAKTQLHGRKPLQSLQDLLLPLLANIVKNCNLQLGNNLSQSNSVALLDK